MSLKSRLLLNWRLIAVILIPIVLLPLVFIKDDDMILIDGEPPRPSTKLRALYAIAIIGLYWMLEALPLAVTSLMPVVLFPLLGVMSTSDVSVAYMKETNMMLMGGIIIALAVEYCNFHRRIALKVMNVIGSSPIRLMLGIMVTTMFLSMWISNTATAAMMVPIVVAILDELKKVPNNTTVSVISQDSPPITDKNTHDELSNGKVASSAVDVNDGRTDIMEQEAEEEKRRAKTKKMYLFAVAYSANIGGTGVITGTGPNLVFQGLIKDVDVGQNGKYLDITFATWLGFNVPGMLINVFFAWLYLTWKFFGIPHVREWPCFARRYNETQLTTTQLKQKATNDKVAKVLKDEYNKLGPMTFHETGVAILFLLVVLLWLFREPKFMPGWGEKISEIGIGDSTSAMFVIFLLFLVPKDLSFITGTPKPGAKPEGLLNWSYVQAKMPWGVVLLLGGGFAISDAAEYSGLSQWIGDQLSTLDELPNEVILIIVMIMTAAITEVSSNVACANLIIPILISLSRSLKLHPLYLTIPATISCSYAFMLPVATPPNAIVFAAGGITIMDMVKTGAFLNFSCLLVFFLINISYGSLLWNFNDYDYPNSTAIKNVVLY